jgi:cell division protein ZipA
MPELRWILIAGGALLLLAIYLWGRRTSPQISAHEDNLLRIPEPTDEPQGAYTFREEPAVELDARQADDLQTAHVMDDAPISADRRNRHIDLDAVDDESVAEPASTVARDRDVRRSRIEPTLGDDTDTIPVDHGAVGSITLDRAAREAIASDHGISDHLASHHTAPEPITAERPQVASVADAAPPSPAPTLSMSSTPPPRRSERRKIMALRIAAGTQRFTGEQLLEALLSENLQHGKYDVFHRLDAAEVSVFSIASMVEPGTFDPSRMKDETYPGITMFAQLPGPIDGLLAFNELLSTARRLQEKLGGVLQDDRGVPLTIHRLERLRQDVRDFQQGQVREMRKADAAPAP